MHATVFSIQIFQYLCQIPPRVCTLVLFIIIVLYVLTNATCAEQSFIAIPLTFNVEVSFHLILAKVFSIHMFQYLNEIVPRVYNLLRMVSTLVLFITCIMYCACAKKALQFFWYNNETILSAYK